MDFLLSFTFDILRDIDKGRLAENLIFLIVLWSRVKPHLKKIEDRMAGIENVMTTFKTTVDESLQHGDTRFSKIESRLDTLENGGDDQNSTNQNPKEGSQHGT